MFKSQLFIISLFTGLLAAITCSGYLIALHEIGNLNPFGQYKYLYWVMYAPFFIGAMLWYRKKNQERMSGQEGIVIGLTTNAISSFLFAILLGAYLQFSDGSAFDTYKKASFELLEAAKNDIVQNMGEATYQSTFANLQTLSIGQVATDQAVGMLIIGFIISFFFMLMIKR